jgi:hypothetical protein
VLQDYHRVLHGTGETMMPIRQTGRQSFLSSGSSDGNGEAAQSTQTQGGVKSEHTPAYNKLKTVANSNTVTAGWSSSRRLAS